MEWKAPKHARSSELSTPGPGQLNTQTRLRVDHSRLFASESPNDVTKGRGGQKVGCQPTWRALIKPPSEWPTSSNQHQQLTERIRPWRRGTSVCLFFFFGLMDSCRDFKQVGYAITTPHQQMDKLLKESSPLHNQDRYTELNRFFSFHFLDQIYFWFSF